MLYVYQFVDMHLYCKEFIKVYISHGKETSILISLAVIAAFQNGFSSFHLQRVRRESELVWNARIQIWPLTTRCLISVSPMPCKLDLHAAAFGPLPNWLHLIPIDVPGALWYFIWRQRRSRAGWCATKFDHSILRRKVSTGTNDGPATKNHTGRRHKRTLQ